MQAMNPPTPAGNLAMRTTLALLTGLGVLTCTGGTGLAQSTSSSASYSLLHSPAGDAAGGGFVAGTGTGVTAEISVGDPASGLVSDVTTGGVQAKGNLVGQLYDVAALAVTGASSTVNEAGTVQMGASATLDDGTSLPLEAEAIAWQEAAPFLAGVGPSGLVTAGQVYGDEGGQNVGGSYLGIADPDGFDLTVLNVGLDDFGLYAGDTIDDDWQVFHFGENNPDAAPGEDPDRDTDSNLTEFLAGFDPQDPHSFLDFKVISITGTTAQIWLNKAIPGRTYRIFESADLVAPYSEILSFSVTAEETGLINDDTSIPVDQNYYRLSISRP